MQQNPKLYRLSPCLKLFTPSLFAGCFVFMLEKKILFQIFSPEFAIRFHELLYAEIIVFPGGVSSIIYIGLLWRSILQQ